LIILAIITLWNIAQITAGGDENPSYECLAAYSKAKGFLEPEFDGVNYDSTQEECTKAIATFSEKIRKDVVEKMSEISTDKVQSECIKGKFTNDDTFVNNIIKGEALASLDDKEKSEKLREIETFAEEFITKAITSCFETEVQAT
jgi:hypothetical protein